MLPLLTWLGCAVGKPNNQKVNLTAIGAFPRSIFQPKNFVVISFNMEQSAYMGKYFTRGFTFAREYQILQFQKLFPIIDFKILTKPQSYPIHT